MNQRCATGEGACSSMGVRAMATARGAALTCALAGLLLLPATVRGGERAPSRPSELHGGSEWNSDIDRCVFSALQGKGIAPAERCSDEVFVRRVYLDAIGTVPTPAEVLAFLDDRRPRKRALLIDALLEREEYADYQALRWCDLLRVKSEFPINLWPNAVQAYHRWIHDAIRANKPYDLFVRELLTSSGSNFRAPPVNFYRAVQGREPAALAGAVALTFMGTRLEHWPADRRDGLAAFFSRVAYKPTAEWKEEIVMPDPAPADPFTAILPDGTSVRIVPPQDPRQVFADWLIASDNRWFARNLVNRVWARLLGRGIIHEPDDIRPDNPPSNPELLTVLEQAFVRSGYDVKAMHRLILNSRTYQQSSVPRRPSGDAEALFAYYPVRRLEAEVLLDALNQVFGGGDSYTSPIPEPFSIIPEHERTINLADASISSSFLELFGRPARDTGFESERNNKPSDAQCLHLLNSSHVQRKIENSGRVRDWVNRNRRSPAPIIRAAYLNILSRSPTPEEMTVAERYFRSTGRRPDLAAIDLAWALVNSKEFLFRH